MGEPSRRRMPPWLDHLHHDLRFSIRSLLKTPGFALTAILTLALGIGATTAIFSVADIVLLRSLPYPNANQLVLIRDELSKMGVHFTGVSSETFEAYQNTACFDAAAAFIQDERTLIESGQADRVSVLSSSPSLPAMLAARTILGRTFRAADWNPAHNDGAILSYSLFAGKFGSNPNAIGKTIRLDDRLYTVTGVMPPDTKLGFSEKGAGLWIPLPSLHEPRFWQFQMLARMRTGVSLRQAQAAITATASHVEKTTRPYRGPNGEDGGYTARVLPLKDQMFGDFRPASLLLIAASALLLLIACVNVASLLLARAATREKEIAMRRALGASGSRLFQQWMTEAAVLSATGGAAGLLIGQWGVLLLTRLSSSELPVAANSVMNPRVLLFTLITSFLTCFLLSLAPALAIGKANLSLRGPGQKRHIANWLVTADVAIAIVLLLGCGLLGKSLARLQQIDPGLRVDHLLAMQLQLSGNRYKEARQKVAFFSELENRITRLPGVVAASEVDRLPVFKVGADTRGGNPFSLDGRPWNPAAETKQMAHTITVGPDYFETMGISLLKGRYFSRSDGANSPLVAIVNQTLERTFFPGANAVGQRILLGAPSPGNPWMTIVGIVGDVRNGALDLPPAPQFFTPQMQNPNGRMYLVVHTQSDPSSMAQRVFSVVHGLDPELAISDVATMQQHVDYTLGAPRFRTVLTSLFGTMALLLAAIGIYGVVSNSVTQRTKEIGVRSALGADARMITAAVLTSGLRPVALGIVLGICGGAMLTRFLASILYQVTAGDPLTFAAAIIVIGIIGAIACFWPALRASRIDPVIALREE